MDYRRTSLVLHQQQQAGINCHIYASSADGVPPYSNGLLLETPTMWWDEERIEATVDREFVLSQLRPDEQVRLDEPLRFGDELTDDTYMEWIEQKAKKIFLILVDIGVPDQIFGVIDDSWDDDDLPVPLDQVERLRLTYEKDEKVDRKFFHKQFNYLLRNVQKGELTLYADDEIVPLEVAEKRPVGHVAGLTHNNFDKVHLPARPDDLLLRRRISLGSGPGRLPTPDFLSGIEAMKVIEHDHLTCLWGSYIHQNYGYLLLTPVNDSNLKSFLNLTPQSFKILPKQDRRVLLLNWMHCLADGLALLHNKGQSHGAIKPSNVMLDIDNHIFLGDCGIFPTFTINGERKGFDKESYDYSAPEQAPRHQAPNPIINPSARSTTRATIPRRNTGPSSSGTPRVLSMSAMSTASSASDGASTQTSSTSSNTPISTIPIKRLSNPITSLYYDPQASDIFSLGTIFLEILTFLLKRASRNFASHRSAKNKTPGRGGGLPDASFHKNHVQVGSWIATLKKDASKKEDKLFRGVSPALDLIEQMLLPSPEERPTAPQVQDRLYTILAERCGLGMPTTGSKVDSRGRIHCETRRAKPNPDFDFNFDELRLASQRAAAAACASVAPASSLSRGSSDGQQTIYGLGMDGQRVSMLSSERERSDRFSISTSKSSGESESKGKSSGDNKSRSADPRKVTQKPKAKAWQAPVYAEISFR